MRKNLQSRLVLLGLAAGLWVVSAAPAFGTELQNTVSTDSGEASPSATPAPTAEPSVTPTATPGVTPTVEPSPDPAENSSDNTMVSPTAEPTPEDASGNAVSSDSSEDTEENEEQPEDSQDKGDTREDEKKIEPVVDPSAGSIYVDVTANEKEVYRYLVGSLGLNRAAAAGLMGNFWHECGFNQAAIGGGGISYGLAQWTGSNFLLLKGWCDSNGVDYRTVKGQMAFLKHDLETRFQGCYAYLKQVPETADGAYQAAVYFCTDYERPLHTAQQAVIRGNTTRVTYWPRYQNAATDGLLDPVEDYMEWLDEYVADDTHGYSSTSVTNDPDVNECSLIWYALYENGYLIGENEKRPFNYDSIAEVLQAHGFEEQTETEADLSKLQYGDIIVNADNSGASVYYGKGKMYLAQQTDTNKKNQEKAGDQGKEVFLGRMESGIARKVYCLKEKDSLPAYAEKALETLPRRDFRAVDTISTRMETPESSYDYLTGLLRESGVLGDGEGLTADTLETVLSQKEFQNISDQILTKADTLRAGDILQDVRYGTGISLGDGYVLRVQEEDGESRILVSAMREGSWRKVLRRAEDQ